jgi:phage terminase small subunit
MNDEKKLTPRQQRFVDQYLVDLNATQAAIRAGYSPRTAAEQACRLLTKVKIAEAIQGGKEKLSREAEITRADVLRELRTLAKSSIDHYRTDAEGNVSLAPGAPPDAMAAIASIDREFHTDAAGNKACKVRIKLWDKPGMLKLAGRHKGVEGFADRVELTGRDGGPIRSVTAPVSELTTEEARDELDALLAEADAARRTITEASERAARDADGDGAPD